MIGYYESCDKVSGDEWPGQTEKDENETKVSARVERWPEEIPPRPDPSRLNDWLMKTLYSLKTLRTLRGKSCKLNATGTGTGRLVDWQTDRLADCLS